MISYPVSRLASGFTIDACWQKYPWVGIPPLELNHSMGVKPKHFPVVKAKLAYHDQALFVIFQAADRFVCARKKQYQERVCEDSCVEFFFTPGIDIGDGYFNLEVNCGGTALFYHQKGRNVDNVPVLPDDFTQIQIAHTLPEIIDPEITKSVTWVVEYCLPFSILAKYAPLLHPNTGVTWRANFYKCADGSSHPHWLTWAAVDSAFPDFHRPEYFGRLLF